VLTDAQLEFMGERARKAGGRLRGLFLQRNAEVFAYFGEVGHTLECVDAALDAGLIDLLWLDRCPLFDNVRLDARWPTLRARLVERVTPIAAELNVTLPAV
jgi:serine/threonine-protein kinase